VRASKLNSASPVIVSWGPVPNSRVTGYNIYRSAAQTGPFVKLNGEPVSSCQFTDSNPDSTENIYMVRAIRLEGTAAGSYWNLSQGAFASVEVLQNGALEFQDLTTSGSAFTFKIAGPPNATVTIERASSLADPVWEVWQNTTLGSSGFETLAGTFAGDQYFRATTGTARSRNAIGAVAHTVPEGWTLFSNPLGTSDSSFGSLFPAVSAPLMTYKFIPAENQYLINSYDPDWGVWDGPEETLYAGEGIWLYNGGDPFQMNLFGELLQGDIYNHVDSGAALISSMYPKVSPIDPDLSYPTSTDEIRRFVEGQYLIYQYDPDLGWDGVPSLGVGEAFWVLTPTEKIWHLNTSVW
jgi:hypothetical protein